MKISKLNSTIENRQSKIENPLPWVRDGVQGEDSHFAAGGCHPASVEYGQDSFLRAVGADSHEDISSENIASHSSKITYSCED